jgi:TIR domain
MAGRLTDRLDAHFGSGTVFVDVESISPGRDFAEVIETAVGSCDVVLAVIGSRWLSAVDDRGRRRLDLPADLVVLEIGAGLARGVPVIPVLVDGASAISEGDKLPDSVAALALRQALRVDHESFPADVAKLITMLERLSPALARAVNGGRRRARLARTAIVATVLATILAGCAMLLAPFGSTDAGPATISHGTTGSPDEQAFGKVVNTFSVAEGRPIGVSKFPSAQTNTGRQNGPAEGAVIGLLCETSGRMVTDKVLGKSSDQWLMTEIDNGRWFVSSLYVDVLSVEGQMPPCVAENRKD